MTLVKLDSGAEIVAEHVDAFDTAGDSTKGHSKRVVVVNGIDYPITPADHARIVKAMKSQQTQDMDIFNAGLPKVTVSFDGDQIPLRMTCNDLRYTIAPEANA
jgi:hypothetical protein